MSVCMNYRGRHFCMETWTIALACIFVLGALALGLSMRPVSTPAASEFARVSEAPLEAAPITPEVTMPKVVEPSGLIEERGLEMEVSKPVVVSQPEVAGVQENPYPENPDIGGQGG